MPLAPQFARDSQATTTLERVPLQRSSITDTPPPVSKLERSSFGSHGLAAFESVTMPEPGQEFCGFQMIEELGHGTFARVYLAKQAALAGREVAVKVTLKPTKEPERLARLQHTNVVPVYSVHEASRAQIIVMPYLGRRTLADALSGFRRKSQGVGAGWSTRKGVATKRGSSVVGSRTRIGITTADAEQKSGSHGAVSADNPIVGKVEAVLRILLQLADGLAHAHDRGVLHLDLKPANVLLADTGEPMLLDFNLSYAEAEGVREVVGGTIPYMAPEQLLDLQKRGKGRVDARTDLYSLGIMAFELLTGKHPFPVTSRTLTEINGLIAARNHGAPRVLDVNPDVPAAVSAIIAKLLQPKPEDRYQTARELREDLDRQLTDRPLKFAPDRAIAERVGKWRRRNPKTLVAMLVAAVLAMAGGAGAFAFHETEKRETRDAEARVRTVRDGLATTRLDLLLPDPAARSRGMKKAMTLLAEFDLPQDPRWHLKPAFQKVPADQRAALAGDLGELLQLVANARRQEGKSNDMDGAAADAKLLQELAKSCFEGNPNSARESFLEGAALFVSAKYDAALRPLEKAVAGPSSHGAANFLLARCRHHMGQFPEAVERYKMAAALLPNDPRPPYFAGLAMGFAGLHGSAEEAFTTALEMDAQYAAAFVARGVSHMEQRVYAEAEKDLTTGLERGAPRMQALHLRAHVRRLQGDDEGATADAKVVAALEPKSDEDFFVRGYTRIQSAPKDALKDFEAALNLNPANLMAHRSRFHVQFAILRDNTEALRAVEQLVRVFPQYALGRAMRALCLARLDRRAESLREVDACRKLLADKGTAYRDPILVYRLALVHAANSVGEPKHRDDAIRCLKEAFRTGFHNFADLETDRDLDSIRDLPAFQQAVKAAKELAN